jgi:ribonuclease J
MLVDCGVTFDGRGLGVDVVHPDFSALWPIKIGSRALSCTHGHEDHIGALPYLLRSSTCPCGAPVPLGSCRERAAEHESSHIARFSRP